MEIGVCLSHSTCFDLPADCIMCLLVEWFAFAGTIVWVADGRLFFADYAVIPCEIKSAVMLTITVRRCV